MFLVCLISCLSHNIYIYIIYIYIYIYTHIWNKFNWIQAILSGSWKSQIAYITDITYITRVNFYTFRKFSKTNIFINFFLHIKIANNYYQKHREKLRKDVHKTFLKKKKKKRKKHQYYREEKKQKKDEYMRNCYLTNKK